jgi:hypothetical protein
MAACRLSAHDQAGSEEKLDPKRLAAARRFLGTANGDRHITLTASTRTGEHSVPDAPGHRLSQHQCKGRAQNAQIRTAPALISRERTSAQNGGYLRLNLPRSPADITELGTFPRGGYGKVVSGLVSWCRCTGLLPDGAPGAWRPVTSPAVAPAPGWFVVRAVQ